MSFRVDFPSLGPLWSWWIEKHCRIPDRFERGKPFAEYGMQRFWTANHGRIRPDATFDPSNPPLNQAFVNRQSQIIAPQKTGKGPWMATQVCLAAVGPSEFIGWAREGDYFDCGDWGCGCGARVGYPPGAPMGGRNPSPLIQLLATSEDQVGNVWRPLTTMINLGPLKHLLLPRGEFIRIVGDTGDKDMDRIDRVTASAKSRLGAPISAGFFDESGMYTESNGVLEVADTMRRNAAGMGGRTMETTNAFDPAMNSYAQQTWDSQAADIFKYWRNPKSADGPRRKDGTLLSFRDGRERKRILSWVYEGARHINLDSIDAEAVKLMETDPAQAERFFGNMPTEAMGAWLPAGLWERAYRGLAA